MYSKIEIGKHRLVNVRFASDIVSALSMSASRRLLAAASRSSASISYKVGGDSCTSLDTTELRENLRDGEGPADDSSTSILNWTTSTPSRRG